VCPVPPVHPHPETVDSCLDLRWRKVSISKDQAVEVEAFPDRMSFDRMNANFGIFQFPE
jgi:hypothetical protein